MMADQFTAGQRVRILATSHPTAQQVVGYIGYIEAIGGLIVQDQYLVRVPGQGMFAPFHSSQLAVLPGKLDPSTQFQREGPA